MPTPRPIIVASVGASVGTSITCPASVTSARPAARPASATTMGSPIATTPPSVTRSTTAAAARPIASLWSTVVGAALCPIVPPKATFRSGGASSRAAATIASASPSRRSSPSMSSQTDAYATLRPELRPWRPAGVNGLVTEATCGAARTRAIEASIAARNRGATTVPASTPYTTRPGAPAGTWTSRSTILRARSLCVPGSAGSLLVRSPATSLAARTPARATAHATSTTARWRTQRRPRRSSGPAMRRPYFDRLRGAGDHGAKGNGPRQLSGGGERARSGAAISSLRTGDPHARRARDAHRFRRGSRHANRPSEGEDAGSRLARRRDWVAVDDAPLLDHVTAALAAPGRRSGTASAKNRAERDQDE